MCVICKKTSLVKEDTSDLMKGEWNRPTFIIPNETILERKRREKPVYGSTITFVIESLGNFINTL